MKRSLVAIAVLVLTVAAFGVPASLRAQRQGSASAASARDTAPIDLTGYWVSYVTENWRYRMVTPAKGEYRRIPASPAALPIISGVGSGGGRTCGRPVQVVRCRARS